MKKTIIVISLMMALFIGDACSTNYHSRTERVNSEGDRVKTERRVDDNGVVIKKKRRDRGDKNDRGVKVKVRRDRKRDRDRDRDNDNDEPAIIIKKR
jgi:hypothetical protein